MSVVKALQCGGADQRLAESCGTEVDARLPQPLQVQCIHALGRRDAPHIRQMFLQESGDARGTQVFVQMDAQVVGHGQKRK